jgi:hypothetical protein
LFGILFKVINVGFITKIKMLREKKDKLIRYK